MDPGLRRDDKCRSDTTLCHCGPGSEPGSAAQLADAAQQMLQCAVLDAVLAQAIQSL